MREQNEKFESLKSTQRAQLNHLYINIIFETRWEEIFQDNIYRIKLRLVKVLETLKKVRRRTPRCKVQARIKDDKEQLTSQDQQKTNTKKAKYEWLSFSQSVGKFFTLLARSLVSFCKISFNKRSQSDFLSPNQWESFLALPLSLVDLGDFIFLSVLDLAFKINMIWF